MDDYTPNPSGTDPVNPPENNPQPQQTPPAYGQPQPPYQQPPYAQTPPPYGQPGQTPPPYGQPPYAPNGGYYAYPNQQKSRLAAGLLGILLGSLGVHNFYLGYTGKAVAQLLITLLTCGAGAVISGIWGLIEGIMLLSDSTSVDAKGIPLKD